MTELSPEEFEKFAKFNDELDISWCDEYEGNPHLVDNKSLTLKPGKKNRPTKAEIKKENEMWEEMEKERLETMPRPPKQAKKTEIQETLQILKGKIPDDQYEEIERRVEEAASNDPDAWTSRPSTSSGNGPLESIDDIITFLAPYIDQHINQVLSNTTASHLN